MKYDYLHFWDILLKMFGNLCQIQYISKFYAKFRNFGTIFRWQILTQNRFDRLSLTVLVVTKNLFAFKHISKFLRRFDPDNFVLDLPVKW